MNTFGIGEVDYVNVCGRGMGESKRACMPPSSTPLLRRSCTLNSWRRVAQGLLRREKRKAPKKGGGIVGSYCGAVV